MDRFFVILTWIIGLLVILGILRYWQGANELGKTFFGWFYGESQLLAGLNPQTGGVANYPNYNSRGA